MRLLITFLLLWLPITLNAGGGKWNRYYNTNQYYHPDLKGVGLKKLVSFSDNDHWHLDFKNSKIRVFFQKGKESKLVEFDW